MKRLFYLSMISAALFMGTAQAEELTKFQIYNHSPSEITVTIYENGIPLTSNVIPGGSASADLHALPVLSNEVDIVKLADSGSAAQTFKLALPAGQNHIFLNYQDGKFSTIKTTQDPAGALAPASTSKPAEAANPAS